MRRVPPWVFLMLSLVFGALATWMFIRWLPTQQAAAPPPPKIMVEVVAAAADIKAGEPLKGRLQLVTKPKEEVKGNVLYRIDEFLETKTYSQDLRRGDLIVNENLIDLAGINARVTPGMRAISLKVDEAAGIAGFVNPNNRVDVVVTSDKGDLNKDPASAVVVTNVRVLAAGQRTETRAGEKPQVVPTVTLEVTPDEAKALTLATLEGKLSLILRNQEDHSPTSPTPIHASSLFGGGVGAAPKATPAAVQSPASRPLEIIVMKGSYRPQQQKEVKPARIETVRWQQGFSRTETVAAPPTTQEVTAQAQ
jgi:pilus assembly protein CpaB